MTKFLISVVGPTAIGKTSLAIKLARHFNTEIISADSRQVFREMRIGTAVPSEDELSKVKHHFIQDRSILEGFNAGDFEQEALDILEKLYQDHNIAVMVGGSGLYLDAVIKGFDDFPEIDPEIRQQLITTYEVHGLPELVNQLKRLDPDTANSIDPDNPHRVIRALEVCIGSGQPYSSFLSPYSKMRAFKPIKIGLIADRGIIYERVDERVDVMMKEGLLEEARILYKNKDLNALNTVGYKELFNYFDGEWDLDFAVSEIKKNTRRFAKRQITWFKKDGEIKWFDFNTNPNVIIAYVKDQIEKPDN